MRNGQHLLQSPRPHHQPSARELRRFLEYRSANELGYELPLDSLEAAEYVGYAKESVEHMARDGQIPAHLDARVRRKTWIFYASELDAWLVRRVGGAGCSLRDAVT